MTRMLAITRSVASANEVEILFPNGAKFSSTDVFVGALLLHELVVTQNVGVGSGSAAIVSVKLYDAINASTGKILNGGTTTTESFRVIAGGTILETSDKQPYVVAATPNAQLTACQLKGTLQKVLDPTNEMRIPMHGLHFPAGCVATIEFSDRIDASISMEFTPLASGWARRRRAYRPGSTTKATVTPFQVSL